MRKDELVNFGIPAENLPAFRKVYWADVKIQAERMAKGETGATAPLPALRDAINAMVRLIDDENHLAQILSNVNRHHAQYAGEKRGLVANSCIKPPTAPANESEGVQDVPKD